MFKIEIPEYQRQRPVIQLIPLIDILLYMLIFFMATTVMQQMETELSISVPVAVQSQENTRTPGKIIINIDRAGAVVVNRRRLSDAELGGVLKRLSELYPDQAIIIRADRQTRHEAVVKVLDAAASAGIWNIAFSTLKEEQT